MKEYFKNNKIKIWIAALMIIIPWTLVLLLETKISSQLGVTSFDRLEKDICLEIPPGCSIQNQSTVKNIYCRDGSIATITAQPGMPKKDFLNEIKSFELGSNRVYVGGDPNKSSDSKTTYWIDAPLKNYRVAIYYKSPEFKLLGVPQSCRDIYSN